MTAAEERVQLYGSMFMRRVIKGQKARAQIAKKYLEALEEYRKELESDSQDKAVSAK